MFYYLNHLVPDGFEFLVIIDFGPKRVVPKSDAEFSLVYGNVTNVVFFAEIRWQPKEGIQCLEEENMVARYSIVFDELSVRYLP